MPEAPTCDAQISSTAGNNYARFGSGNAVIVFSVQIHAHGFARRIGTLLAP